MESKEIRQIIDARLDKYIIGIYKWADGFGKEYYLGAFRAYVHCLGEFGYIKRTTEFRLCALDFSLMTFRRARLSVRFLLDDSFGFQEQGSSFESFENEVLLNWALERII